MKKVMLGCMCAVCAVMVSGCASMERKIRGKVADELGTRADVFKHQIVEQPCEEVQSRFEVFIKALQAEIRK